MIASDNKLGGASVGNLQELVQMKRRSLSAKQRKGVADAVRYGLVSPAPSALDCKVVDCQERVAKTNTVSTPCEITEPPHIEAIKQALPALAGMFGVAKSEIQKKPLAERSTEDLIGELERGRFVAEVAMLWSEPTSKLNKWIAADPERCARAKIARINQAAFWDLVALQVLLYAPSDRVEITRAEKIAQHCRWRAAAFCRDGYGQSLKVSQVEQPAARNLTTRELEIIARGRTAPGGVSEPD